MPNTFVRQAATETILANDINELQTALENIGGESLVVAGAGAPAKVLSRADYVATGTNDQTVINAAINALGAASGRVCCVGDFSLSDSILVNKGGISLVGVAAGQSTGGSQVSIGTRFKKATAFVGPVILVQTTANDKPAHGVLLRDFMVEGAFLGTDSDGILFRSNMGRIDNVHVKRMTGWGIKLRGYTAAERGVGATSDWDTYDSGLIGVQVADCYNTGVRSTATAGGGVWFSTAAPDGHMVNCVIFNNYDNLRIGSASEQITGCHFYDAERYNVWFDGGGSRSKLIGCKIEGAGQHGIMMDNTISGTSDVIIVGNNLKNNGDLLTNTYDHINITGISSNGTSRTLIVGNAFSKDSATATLTRNAINMSSASQSTLIDGNTFGSDTHYGSTRISGSGAAATPVVFGANTGYVTEAGGTVSVANLGTIAHTLGDSFLGRTPKKFGVVSTVAGIIATATAGSTTLTVSLRSHDGTTPAATVVSWFAEL